MPCVDTHPSAWTLGVCIFAMVCVLFGSFYAGRHAFGGMLFTIMAITAACLPGLMLL